MTLSLLLISCAHIKPECLQGHEVNRLQAQQGSQTQYSALDHVGHLRLLLQAQQPAFVSRKPAIDTFIAAGHDVKRSCKEQPFVAPCCGNMDHQLLYVLGEAQHLLLKHHMGIELQVSVACRLPYTVSKA